MAPKISTEKMFKRRQKVVAAVDLPGAPAGTPGKVWFVSGITWIRYHVVFENGTDLANVDGAQLTDLKAFRQSELDAERVRDDAERAVSLQAARAEGLANLADGPHSH